MSNRLKKIFADKSHKKLSIYFTAGFPHLEDTLPILKALQREGVDLVEIGIPFSDPLADGPVIQHSSEVALKNGMTLKLLFEQLQNVREETDMPLILMGYLNPVMQFGVEAFCQKAHEVGVDGVILPDLPILEYQALYQPLFEKYDIINIFLVTPQTSEERIRAIDDLSKGFIYAVSSSSTTGGELKSPTEYLQSIESMKLKNPVLVGFGISDRKSFEEATAHADGGIIGSAFIKAIENSNDLTAAINKFVTNIKVKKLSKLH